MIKTLSEQQKKILRFAVQPEKYLICDGAVRSGKTVVMSLAFIIWAMENFDGCNFGICSKTVANAERNVLTPLLTSNELPYKMAYRRQERILVVSCGDRINRFYLFGGKDESSYMLVQGITLAGVLLDEVALMPRSFVEQVMARTLTYPNRKIWFNCNPEGQLHWFNQEWIIPTDEGKKAARHLHFLMSDNPIMTTEQIEETKEMFSGVFYDRYIKGLWVAAEGIIFDCFSKDKHVLKSPSETEGDFFVSSDFGIQNATTFLLWRKEKGSNRWICLDEYYYSGREERAQKTVSELTDDLIAMLPRNEYGDLVKPKRVIVDPSAAALIAELRKKDFHVQPANNDVLDGISDVSTLLNGCLLAFTTKCKHTIEEFGIYAWDAKAAQRGEDRPIKENDHCMDAVRYFVKSRHLARSVGAKQYEPIFM